MLSGLEVTLIAAALLIGLTGAWSPCGYSMVETIGPAGHCGGQRTTFAALATFTPGALIGGAITFGSLAWLGALIHGAGRGAYLVAAVIAALAALAEARGVPIVPQIRRQLPEHWRRVMPMPVAAALYGVLLGLGFTTFVLSFGVWALAGISLALGDPGLGLAIGVAFGAGRAIPVIGLAPLARRPVGSRVITAMAERPAFYRGFRLGDAAMLGAAATVLALSGPAASASTVQVGAADPGIAGFDLVFQRSDRSGVLRRAGADTPLPGTDPAIGGPYIAVRNGNAIDLLDRGNPSIHVKDGLAAGGADAIAVSQRWLVFRVHTSAGDAIKALDIADPLNPGPPKLIASIGAPGRLSHPSLDGSTVVFASATPRVNQIVQKSIASGRARTLVKSTSLALQNPAVLGKEFLYVSIDGRRQRLILQKLSGHPRGKVIYSRNRTGPHLDSTALGSMAYATLLAGNGSPPAATLLSFRR